MLNGTKINIRCESPASMSSIHMYVCADGNVETASLLNIGFFKAPKSEMQSLNFFSEPKTEDAILEDLSQSPKPEMAVSENNIISNAWFTNPQSNEKIHFICKYIFQPPMITIKFRGGHVATLVCTVFLAL